MFIVSNKRSMVNEALSVKIVLTMIERRMKYDIIHGTR